MLLFFHNTYHRTISAEKVIFFFDYFFICNIFASNAFGQDSTLELFSLI